MTKDEALKMALEALEVANSCIDGYYIPKGKTHLPEIELAITAIKEALAQPEHGWTPERIAGMARLKDAQDKRLAQPEQEPVTWRYKIVDVFGRPAWTLKTPKSDTRVLESQPLYTTPPQRKPEQEPVALVYDPLTESITPLQRTWVGLTPQERDEINEQVYGAVPHHVAFHAAIEQALREKNT